MTWQPDNPYAGFLFHCYSRAETDRYGRTVARIILAGGESLNRAMVLDGFAWWYRKYAPGDFSEALQAILGPGAPNLSATTITRLKVVPATRDRVWPGQGHFYFFKSNENLRDEGETSAVRPEVSATKYFLGISSSPLPCMSSSIILPFFFAGTGLSGPREMTATLYFPGRAPSLEPKEDRRKLPEESRVPVAERVPAPSGTNWISPTTGWPS